MQSIRQKSKLVEVEQKTGLSFDRSGFCAVPFINKYHKQLLKQLGYFMRSNSDGKLQLFKGGRS